MGPLGRVGGAVRNGPGLLARARVAAGLPARDPDGRPIAYALRPRGSGVVQLLPRLTAAAVSPRLRRLMADYQLIRNEFTGHPTISVQPGGGYPPERYAVTYRVRGVQAIDEHERPILSNHHVADIYLHQGYPREKPKCTLRTPIYHPNFGSYICIADHWAPGETLVDVIVHIGRMIQYQTFNPDSPLNGLAAQWARRHRYLFPVGDEPLYQPEVDISLAGGLIPSPDEMRLGPEPEPPPDAALDLSFD